MAALCFLALHTFARRTKPLIFIIIMLKSLIVPLIFGSILWILLYSDYFMTIFKLFLIQLSTAYSHSSLDSFSFTLNPRKLRDYWCSRCSRSSIFVDFNSSFNSKYASFPSMLLILSFSLSMNASLAFSFSSNVDLLSFILYFLLLCSSIKLFR